MKMSVACGVSRHDSCDGSAFNALDDAAFLESFPEAKERCACFCHVLSEETGR